MNHWHVEVMAELHRREIERELRGIRLEEQVLAQRVYRPGWLAATLFGLANWMIATGKQIRRRYAAPVLGCGQERTSSYVR